jgi:leader peptidase (prepilin peptidase) / N-methyltransferase
MADILPQGGPLIALTALLGLLIGSFLNVVIHRKPLILERLWLSDTAQYLQDGSAMQRVLGSGSASIQELRRVGLALETEVQALPVLSISRPRSRCPHCGHAIRWWENIPLASWLLLRGRCSNCQARVSVRYPVIELLTGVLFASVAWRHGGAPATAVYCLAISIIIAAAFIDLDTTLLPDDLTLPLIATGLIASWQGWIAVSLPDSALGALFGYLSLWAVATLYRLVRGVEGMAEGDFKLLAGLGALLGWQSLASIILLSSAVGAVVGLFMILARGHKRQIPIPFGPYLAGGGIASLFFGPQLNALWTGG